MLRCVCSTFLCSLVWLLRGQWCFPYLVGHSVWTGRWEVPTAMQNSEKDHDFHGTYWLRFVVAHNRLHFSQFHFNMHLLKYNPQCLKIQKGKCSIILGFRGFFIWNSSLGMDAENWMLEILPWPPTRRAVIVGRGMKVRMPWGWGWKQKSCDKPQAL